MQAVGGFDIKELFRLYPGKPAKKMAYLAGLKKPVGCVEEARPCDRSPTDS